jgi:PAS domain S-box-containing protein
MIYTYILTAAVFMGVCFVIVFILATRFSRPLTSLTESARKLSKGDFSVSSDIKVRSKDELGILGEAFIDMSEDLKESYRKLEEYSTTLEEKVEKRTEELNRSLNETAEARDRTDGILKSVADGLIVTDINNRVILMNRAAEDLLGVRFSEVINRPIDYAIEEKTLREKVTETLSKKSTGYFFDFHLAGDDPQHPRIMRARTSVTHDRDGRETGIVTIMHDVTHEREVDRMKTEFISTAAHELRTPLTSIQGFSEILMTRDDLETEEQRRFLSYINKQSVDLTHIINDLLDISRIESGRGFALNKTFFNTSDTITGILPYFQEHYTGHRFEATLFEEPLELYADKDKIEQVIKNLLSNSAKYSPDGGLIQVTERLRPGEYQVKIEDEGIGMTPEQLEKIFEKFYRVDASDMGVEGTGLGMTIVKYIVEAHKGEIKVESEPGKGTVVTFTVPMEAGKADNKNQKSVSSKQ